MLSIMRSSLILTRLKRALLYGALFVPLCVDAAALGEVTVRSSIGQRLEADIDLVLLSAAEAESLVVRLAPADAFSGAGIDYTALLRSLRFSLEKKGDRHRVHVTSELAVSEPFLNLLVELSANGSRTIRQYALLIDPPGMEQATEANSVTSGVTSAPADTGNAPAAAVPVSTANTHVVRKGDTLRSIAHSLQPTGVQIEQVMVALQEANPSAFVDRNANRMRTGSTLTVPDAGAMRSVDPATARRALRMQTADFLRYQRQMAERSATASPAASDPKVDVSQPSGNRSSSGGVSVSTDDSKAVPVAQDKLTLSLPSKGDTPASGARDKDTLDKLATEKALADANSRIAALEKNISQMQSLLELQNQRLTEAQQRVSPSADTKPDARPDIKSESKPEAKPEAKDAAATESSDASAKAEPATPETVATDSPSVVVAKPPAPAPKVGKSEATTFSLDDELISAAAGGVVVVLLMGWWLIRSRRQRNDAAVIAKAEPQGAQTVIAESGGRQIDTNHSVFHSNFVPSISQIDANEVDAVAEADVYIAYGRDEQAEEILLDALRAHPQRHALRVKLLEIYANRNDKQRFGTLAAELRVLTHGQGPEWVQAAKLGQALDPRNQLFGTPSHTTMASDIAMSEPESRSPVDDFELKLEGMLEERRKAQFDAPAQSTTTISHTIDFELAGMGVDSSQSAQAPSGTGSELGADALTTKLELALACRELGDHDGARELLAEVANARDAELAGRAKSLLQQLA